MQEKSFLAPTKEIGKGYRYLNTINGKTGFNCIVYRLRFTRIANLVVVLVDPLPYYRIGVSLLCESIDCKR